MMNAIELLRQLIATESFSRMEGNAADVMSVALAERGIEVKRHLHNVYALNKHFDPDKPTLLLNSHLDTVRPNTGWTRDPFSPDIHDGKLFGLGSNDAGGSVVALAAVFAHFYERKDLAYNLIYAATAEEEVSGANGIASLVGMLPPIDCAIVGEPTEMKMAIAEKGLMVLRCTAIGKGGHAARNEGVNAIGVAMHDIQWFHSYKFERVSDMLGPVKMTVTIINAGSQHNVIPDRCEFTVDIRTTDSYTHDETLEIITSHIRSEIGEVSKRLQPSTIQMAHPLVRAGLSLGLPHYGSPTLSDQSLLRVPSLKLGPGASQRSHTSDEFIYCDEITHGIAIYTALLENALNPVESPKSVQ